MDTKIPKLKRVTNHVIKPRLTSRIREYHVQRQRGVAKGKAAIAAGYAVTTEPATIERTEAYKRLTVKDALLEQTTLQEIAAELLKNVRQDQDRGAKNKGIEIALQRIEPEVKQEYTEEKVIILLKG